MKLNNSKLLQARKSKGLTRKKVLSILEQEHGAEMTEATLMAWETETSPRSVEVLFKLCKLLGVSPVNMVTEKGGGK